jgi:hypothetical protein
MTITPHAARKSKGVGIIDFLRPHWKALTLALLAVVCEVATAQWQQARCVSRATARLSWIIIFREAARTQ